MLLFKHTIIHVELYEIFPMPGIDYLRVKLNFFLSKANEMIYWHDPDTNRIRLFMRTSASAAELRKFFAMKPVDEDLIPTPKYVADVKLFRERDFYMPVKFNILSNFVLSLPKGYQMRIWAVHDPILKKILGERLEKKNAKLRPPEQVAAALLKGPIYLFKIYLLGDDKYRLAKLVKSLSEFVVTESGKLDATIEKTRGLFSKWVDTVPSVGLSGYFAEARKWLWGTEDDFPFLFTIPTTGKVKLAASADFPYVHYDRSDFLIGRDLLYDEDVFLDWTDFQRHALILGSTGSGKSNTLEVLATSLMSHGIVVFVDPNSQSARKLSKLAKLYFTIGGPDQDPNFGINIFKVPSYFKNRDEGVDYVVDKAEQLFKRMLNLTENAVYVSFVVKVVLRALLKKHDEITFEDFYETLLALWNEEIDINELLDPDDRRAASELEILQGLRNQTFASVLARIEYFVNNRKFRIITSQNTIDWDRIIQITGGRGLVVFDVGKGASEDVSVSVMGLLAISLFNYVYLMDALRKDHPPIFLIVDEAHNITHFDFIPLIFKEARKYKLHMILATQSLASIINTAGTAGGAEINNNTNVKILMRANDALEAKIEADAVGGQFADRIRILLPQLGVGQAVLVMTPRPGEVAVPKLIQIRRSDLELKDEAEPSKGFEPNPGKIPRVGHPIRTFFSRNYPFNPIQQLILFKLTIRNGVIDQPTLLKETGIERDRLTNEAQSLVNKGVITVGTDEKTKAKVFVLNEKGWFLTGLDAIAPSQDGMLIAANAMLHYINLGYYVIPVRQSPDLKYKPDLVAVKRTPDGKVDYDNNIAIEVESPNELTRTPDQVAKNMRKYAEPEMKIFKEIHFWTTEDAFPKLKDIYTKFMEDPSVPQEIKEKVKIFAVRQPGKPTNSGQNQQDVEQQTQNSQQSQQQVQKLQHPLKPARRPVQTQQHTANQNDTSATQQDKATQKQEHTEDLSTQQVQYQESKHNSNPKNQKQVPKGQDPIEIVTKSGQLLKVYKNTSTLEFNGMKFRLPPFEIHHILEVKDMITETSLSPNKKKIAIRLTDDSLIEIIPLSSSASSS